MNGKKVEYEFRDEHGAKLAKDFTRWYPAKDVDGNKKYPSRHWYFYKDQDQSKNLQKTQTVADKTIHYPAENDGEVEYW